MDDSSKTLVAEENDKVAVVKIQYAALMKLKRSLEKEQADLKMLRADVRVKKSKDMAAEELNEALEPITKGIAASEEFLERLTQIAHVVTNMPDNEEDSTLDEVQCQMDVLKVEAPSMLEAARAIRKSFK